MNKSGSQANEEIAYIAVNMLSSTHDYIGRNGDIKRTLTSSFDAAAIPISRSTFVRALTDEEQPSDRPVVKVFSDAGNYTSSGNTSEAYRPYFIVEGTVSDVVGKINQALHPA